MDILVFLVFLLQIILPVSILFGFIIWARKRFKEEKEIVEALEHMIDDFGKEIKKNSGHKDIDISKIDEEIRKAHDED